MPYGRDQMTAIALDLVSRGFAVWNLEYRRLGVATSGWPGTFEDVVAGIDHLADLVATGIDLALDHVAVIGHSAGGHLALWASGALQRVQIAGIVGQAPITDLIEAHHLGVGGSAVSELLGGTPSDHAMRYRDTSPIMRLPLGIPQLIIHGTADDVVPIGLSYAYTQAASLASDHIELLELSDMGHMEYLDPTSQAHASLCNWLGRMIGH